MRSSWSDLFRTSLFKGNVSASLSWQVLDELFAAWPHVIAFAGILLTAAFTLATGAGSFAGLAIAVAALHLALRCSGSLWYARRAKRQNPTFWINVFIVSALFSGAAWGASVTLLLYSAPASGRYLILTVACVIIQSATARTFMAPLPLLGQTFLLMAQVVGASFHQGDWIIAPAAILFAAFQLVHMRNLIGFRQRQLQVEAEKDALLQQIARTNEELRIANELLQKTALTDVLTGLSNRRALNLWLEAHDPGRDARLMPYSLILFDVDHFKSFNDTHGHQAGDTCLAAIGAELRALPLPDDHLAARYGGEEFVVILPRTDGRAAIALAETIRQRLAALEIPVARSQARITVSLGIASLVTTTTDSPPQLLTRADTALYRAKQGGRNRLEYEAAPTAEETAAGEAALLPA